MPAQALYTSSWFVKASAYARHAVDVWFILSAKHGLLFPDKVIAPYNETLNAMPVELRRAWAARVLGELRSILEPGDRTLILASQRYRQPLVGPLREKGYEVDVPMAGLRIGEQLHWLNEHTV